MEDNKFIEWAKVNNPEAYKEFLKTQKDYLILSIKLKLYHSNENYETFNFDETGKCIYRSDMDSSEDTNHLDKLLEEFNCIIQQVKRLSDGAIFTLGDFFFPNTAKNNINKIIAFEFIPTGAFRVKGDNSYMSINGITKTDNRPRIVGTTMDRISVFGYNKVFGIDPNTLSTKYSQYEKNDGFFASQAFSKPFKNYFWFHSIEAAEKFRNDHLMINITDALSILNKYGLNDHQIDSIEHEFRGKAIYDDRD